MSAVEQEPDLFNSADVDVVDAYDAWSVLAASLNGLPEQARPYFTRLCAKVGDFDPHVDEELALTQHLEVAIIRTKPQKKLGAKSKHDYATIFDWVDSWQRNEGENLEAALKKYIEVYDLEDGYETIKSAYHRVRKARLASMQSSQAF